MKILSLKYKMHKLVNLVFYVIVFGLGFLLGFLGNKINFNDLLSNFLFIDNVNAYTLQSGENFEVNEEYIFNKFSENENFNLVDFPYIHCYQDISGGTKVLSCHALSTIDIFNSKMYQNSYTNIYFSKNSHTHYLLTINYNDNSILSETLDTNKSTSLVFLVHTENSQYFTYTNYDIPNLSSFPGNVLDFSSINAGEDNKDEDVEVEIVNDNFYNFSKKIIGDLGEENYFIYDFITLGLISVCFIFFVLLVGYIIKKFFGG